MTLQKIKQEFYTYRNGAVADTLRKTGWPHAIIFGLNVPQLAAIGSAAGRDRNLGLELWSDTAVRESRLLAAYILPTDMSLTEVEEICSGVLTREEADMLAFRWLRHVEGIAALAEKWASDTDSMHNYLAEAVARFIS